MRRLEVGQPFLGRSGPSPEGVQLSLSGSAPELQLFLSGLTEREVESVRTGPCRFGVCEAEGALFFLYRFDPSIPWSDSPYHRALEERLRPVNLALLGEQSRALLTVVLVSAEDSVVRAIRAVSLSPEVTRALWQAVLLQDALPADYDARIRRAYARYTSRDLARLGTTGKGGE